MSDIVHLLEEYKMGDDQTRLGELEAELRAAKEERKKAKESLVKMESRATEVAKTNTLYLQQVSELEAANGNLTGQVTELQRKMQEMQIARDEALRLRGESEKKVKAVEEVNRRLGSEVEGLKLEVQKGVEEIAKGLGEGYDRCLTRMASVGVDISGHSFVEYIKEFAKSMSTGDGGGAAREGGGS